MSHPNPIHILTFALGCLFVGAAWKEENAETLRKVQRAIRCALGAVDMNADIAARECRMSNQLWSALYAGGVNLTAAMVVAVKRPDFWHRLRAELDTIAASGDRRRERLNQIPTPAPKKCEALDDSFSVSSRQAS